MQALPLIDEYRNGEPQMTQISQMECTALLLLQSAM